MIFSSNVFAAHPGHANEFTGLMADMLGVILEHGVQAGIKVSVSGASTTEVFINSVFENMSDFAASTEAMRQSKNWVDVYMSIGNSAATIPVDSFIAEVLTCATWADSPSAFARLTPRTALILRGVPLGDVWSFFASAR